MNKQQILRIFNMTGVIITNTHVIYTSGNHGDVYINKDALFPHTQKISGLCRIIAKRFANDNTEVVIGPAVGGAIISQWTAYYLSKITSRDVLSVYAEKSVCGNIFVIKRGYDKIIVKKNVLVVEDIINTGGSIKRVVEAVRALKGNVIGVGALYNRGEVATQKISDLPELFAVINAEHKIWSKADCPLCAKNVPINTKIGKGKNA